MINNIKDLRYEFSNHYISVEGQHKYDKVKEKIWDSSMLARAFRESIERKIVPHEVDFTAVIHQIPYFIFSKNRTIIMGVLEAIVRFDEEVNEQYNLCTDTYLLKIGFDVVNRYKNNL